MRRIVVSEYLPEKFLARLGVDFEVLYDPDLYADRPRLLHEAGAAEAVIIRNRTRNLSRRMTLSLVTAPSSPGAYYARLRQPVSWSSSRWI